MNTPKPTSSGIQTFADGQAYIPSSRRADGSTRKEIKVRPGYKPPEDVERYRSRTADTWRNRGSAGVPGADDNVEDKDSIESKSKNAKRREAARKKKESGAEDLSETIENRIAALSVGNGEYQTEQSNGPAEQDSVADQDAEHQKKIRNQLKKLKAIRELKAKRATGEKLAAEQLIKISKEQEILRDLAKLDYHGLETEDAS